MLRVADVYDTAEYERGVQETNFKFGLISSSVLYNDAVSLFLDGFYDCGQLGKSLLKIRF
jgi:hypothetical protein